MALDWCHGALSRINKTIALSIPSHFLISANSLDKNTQYHYESVVCFAIAV